MANIRVRYTHPGKLFSYQKMAGLHMFLLIVVAFLALTEAFLPSCHNLSPKQPFTRSLSQSSPRRSRFATTVKFAREDDEDEDEDEEDDDESDIDLGEDDWRDFRAKLVMKGEPQGPSSKAAAVPPLQDDGDLDGFGALFAEEQTTAVSTSQDDETTEAKPVSMTPLDPSQWAYDSGKIIEQGAVILGGVEQDFGFGLRQQYFHKAAILVLDHDEATFTKGILLNRPTDLVLDDDINEGVKWRVWFGGDVQGLGSANPDIVCIHALKNKKASKASVPIMKDMQWTTFENAKRLVQSGAAKPTEFRVFCGYAGWGAGQLMGELDRKSWYMVATDSLTLLKELARQSDGADPRDAGLEMWTLLMNMIGRGETAEEYSGDFDDLMLKEWALKNLLSTEAGGGAGERRLAPEGVASTQELLKVDPVNRLLNRVSAASRGEDVNVGSLVRASSAERSPFLLLDQELHKSVVLLISDDDNISVGVILNRPVAKGLDIQITEKETGKSKTITVPLRFGGQYAVKGSKPLLWLHCNSLLRAAKIGSPVGAEVDGIWKCTADDVIASVGKGLVTPDDFMVVSGVSVWTKGEGGVARGMQGEVRAGFFEPIPLSKTAAVWDTLSKQEVLTNANLVRTLAIAGEAWSSGAPITQETENSDDDEASTTNTPIGGLGEGFDEEDDSLVFKSDVEVSKLSDDALRSWVATFLLGAPTLGG
jgi:putative AlgH/UPF0301 family transcriptional regulator